MRTPSISKKSVVCSLQACPAKLSAKHGSAVPRLPFRLSTFDFRLSKPSSVCPRRRRRSAAGFTLLELLIVISVIMVLMGLLIPAFDKVRKSVRARKRSIDVSVIQSAIGLYKTQEKKFPADDLDGGVDLWYGADYASDPPTALAGGYNKEVMKILTNAVPSVLDPNKLRWDAAGNAIDPYDKQYKIWLDLDYSDFGAGYKVQ